MGANHQKWEAALPIVDGVGNFTGAQVVAPDLRAGAALVLAGLAADGYTTVDEIGYVERGYEELRGKTPLPRRSDRACGFREGSTEIQTESRLIRIRTTKLLVFMNMNKKM